MPLFCFLESDSLQPRVHVHVYTAAALRKTKRCQPLSWREQKTKQSVMLCAHHQPVVRMLMLARDARTTVLVLLRCAPSPFQGYGSPRSSSRSFNGPFPFLSLLLGSIQLRTLYY